MNEKEFCCAIGDTCDVHFGFDLRLSPGYTALVGPNGTGKTTLLQQLKQIAHQRGYRVFSYSNLRDGGASAINRYLRADRIDLLSTAQCSSEGETIMFNFVETLSYIGTLVRKSVQSDTPLMILLDGLDSGTSIDRQREIMNVFSLIEKDIGVASNGAEHDIYVIAAVNSYEMAKRRCVDVRTGEHLIFGGYDEYADFVCRRLKKSRKKKPNTRRKKDP